jgi:hypothetical protein
MQCSNGKVRVVVRSTRVPVGLSMFTMPGQNVMGLSTPTSVRSVVFANVLDGAQQKMLEEARRLAESSCLDLEVVDLGRQNPLRRAVSKLVRGTEASLNQGIHLELRSLSDIETVFNSSIR